MYLKSIQLRDWKAYQDASLTFPAPGRRKNVVLIGAQNGFGKTSLLEAIMFCLYGRDAMPYVARAVDQEGDEGRPKMNYSDFIENAFHARALAESRTSMSVKLEFLGDEAEDEPEYFSVERRWNFNNKGSHLSDEVIVHSGADQKRMRPSRFDDEEDFYRGVIARHTLPPHLAQFFLFDGERVQRLARRDMKSQVRLGIEGLLGAAVLRELADDLREFSRKKQSAVSATGSERLQILAAELAELEAKLQGGEASLAAAARELDEQRRVRDELFERLRGGTGGAFANVRALEEERARLRIEVNQHKEALAQLIVTEFSLALAGKPIRDKLASQLDGELKLARWRGGLETTTGQIERFLGALMVAEPAFSPPLTDAQTSTLRKKVECAWQNLWDPPPADCAEFERHGYLGDSDKVLLLDRLAEVEELGQDTVEELLHQIDAAERDLKKIDQQVASFAGIETTLEKVAKELKAAGEQIGALEKTKSDLERSIEGWRGQHTAKKAEHGRALHEFEEAKPEIAKADVADRISAMLRILVDEAIQGHTEEIARKMSFAYRAMAHSHAIERIEIEPDCNVRMIAKSGADIRGLNHSAGENQIFASALISAVAEAAEIRFPIIVDTPLARLDKNHRLNVLKYFTDRAGEQIILLSQDKEVIGEELNAIRARVAKTFLVETEVLASGKKKSRVIEGDYFEPIRGS